MKGKKMSSIKQAVLNRTAVIKGTADAEVGLETPTSSAQWALELAIEVLEEFYPEESLEIMALNEQLTEITKALENL